MVTNHTWAADFCMDGGFENSDGGGGQKFSSMGVIY